MSSRMSPFDAPPPSASAVSAERRAVVERARDGWVRKLTDLSRRNNLLYFRDLKTGTLDLASPDAAALRSLRRGDAVVLSRLTPDTDAVRTAAQAQVIRRRALTNLEERGLDTLFLALGLATWPSADGGRPAAAPVLLIPVKFESRGRDRQTLALLRIGDVQINDVLIHALMDEHGCRIDADALLEGAVEDDENQSLQPVMVFERLLLAAAAVREFQIAQERAVLGNFSFQKMAMVKDLRGQLDALAEHDLIAAIAGNAEARESVRLNQHDIDRRSFDDRPPEQEFLILDADSSQQQAIAGALALQNGVIHGPPGTGKSQTIANLIAEFVAQGKRVLFVAEKRAALEVVLHRLEDDDVKLGHLVLDLHGADISRKEVMRRFAESLTLVQNAAPVDQNAIHRRLVVRRKQLNDHVWRIHQLRPPAGKSVYQLQGRLLHLSPSAQSTTRWRGAELRVLTADVAERVQDLLSEGGGRGLATLFLRTDPSPWNGAALPDGRSVERALDLVAQLAGDDLPELCRLLDVITERTGLQPPALLDDARKTLQLASEAAAILSVYDRSVFDLDLPAVVSDLQPAASGWLANLWASLFNGRYRTARSQMRVLRSDGNVTDTTLLNDAVRARDLAQEWRGQSNGLTKPTDVGTRLLTQAQQRLAATVAALEELAPLLDRSDFRTMPLERLLELVDRLHADNVTPHRIPRVLEIERDIARLGAPKIVAELRLHQPHAGQWPQMFEYAWLTSCLDSARSEDPAIGAFQGETHQQFVQEFRDLDQQRVKAAAARVRRVHAEHAIAAMNRFPEQAALVRHQAGLTMGHLSLRDLLEKAPNVLTALRPCWMASPLSVSQLLPAGRQYFDMVLFDEASQVLPEDAIPALLRAGYAVVAGDKHQLPPTTFFADGGNTDGDGDSDDAATVAATAGFENLLDVMRRKPTSRTGRSATAIAGFKALTEVMRRKPADKSGKFVNATAGFESLLDVMSSLTEGWSLLWHYRSRDEALIAFSNFHIYRPNDQEMITFPGPGGPPAISHELVTQTLGNDGQEDSVGEEVRHVVALILEHAERQMHLADDRWETLGVIAMGIKHANRIQGVLDAALRERPDLEEFFDTSRKERFFVKNLERVQGDERDAIILTVGYGKDRSGRLPYRFGPLLTAGGERRLNVAITRARRRLTLVSSFSHHDMDPGRSRARGVELLRLYLGYAASQGRNLGDGGAVKVPLNEFEQDIFDALTAAGIALEKQWGASRYRIDLVAKHPERPGEFVLAIECDGASYHSSPTARDRDRLRQQHLEALGWRFHRIWSTDWFTQRASEVQRTLAVYHAAVAAADAQHARRATEPALVAAVATPPVTLTPAVRQRGPRPPVPARASIDDYRTDELDALVRWIKSDDRLRTDDEIVREMVEELGFRRRGTKIDEAVRQALQRERSRQRRT